jgi:solute carrier family 25 (mitochondrial carnitine/acylcarnitine transporter), member 20/29
VRIILSYITCVFDFVCLANVISEHPSTSYFHRILTPAVIDRLNKTAELTLFVPVDSAWNALHPIEKLYLESGFASNDLIRIFELHAVVQNGVKWSESFDPGINRQSFRSTPHTRLSNPTQ